MSSPLYKIGDIVVYRSHMGMNDGGSYEITRLLPSDNPEPSYRLRALGQNYERVAREYELRSAGSGPPPPGGRNPRIYAARKRSKSE